MLVDAGLIEALDFPWDPETDEVGYRAPSLPADLHGEFADPGEVDIELDTLGRVVSEVLENDYLRRDEDEFRFSAGDESEVADGDRED